MPQGEKTRAQVWRKTPADTNTGKRNPRDTDRQIYASDGHEE